MPHGDTAPASQSVHVMIAAFADDKYALLGPVPRANSARAATRAYALRMCGLPSVPSKWKLYSPADDLVGFWPRPTLTIIVLKT
eukprot:6205617-Pleurochrysis_carterae.AAC.7